jgi:3,4-dihydroxy 2-butanone 4-phosphate synthase / GTP cyclohydrolase II
MDLHFPDFAEHRVRAAVAAIAAGRPVVVVDDADRENEGDLIFAATCATPELVAFAVRHTSGFLCVALPGDECDRLALPSMYHRNDDRFGTAYRVTVDLRGTGTGISATARARTIAALGSPGSVAEDFLRPGHVVPLMSRPGGVLRRPGHTEAAVDLVRLAGLSPAGALSEIVSRERPGEMARGAELERFAATHDLVLISIADLVAYQRREEPQVRRAAETALPTEQGAFGVIGYEGLLDGAEHLVLVTGTIADGRPVPVHLHTECLLGDVLGSTACSCRQSLEAAMTSFSAQGRGVVVYLRPAGRNRSCSVLDAGDAAGLTGIAEWILADLGVQSIRQTTGSPTVRVAERATAHRRHTTTSTRIAG